MKTFVCNYAPLRFLPYPETGEFVNVGVVVFCPEIEWFDYRLEVKRRKRIHEFFPELDKKILRDSIATVDLELGHHRNATELQLFGHRLTPEVARPRTLWFKDLIRQREALLHFGQPGVLLAKDPAEALDTLFQNIVRRQFARPKVYQEGVMRRRLAELLNKWKMPYEKDQIVGNQEYHVTMPFVHFVDRMATKVLKPFDLNKPETNEIYNHGDIWVAKMRRLEERKLMPKEVVFAVQLPSKGTRLTAANKICDALKELKVRVVDFSTTDALREAAALESKLA